MSGKRDASLLFDDMVTAAERLMELAGRIPTHGEPPLEVREMVLWNFTQLGEATKRLPPEVRARFPEVPWSDMARMRDRVVHDYDTIHWDKARQIALESVSVALPQLIRVRKQLRDESDSREEPAYYSSRRLTDTAGAPQGRGR